MTRLPLVGLCMALLLARPALAADYHVSASSGRDTLDGRSATVRGDSGPFATLQALQGLRLMDGDRILLRCGERFAGPLRLKLTLGDSGTLTIAGRGDCARKPVIDGRSVPLPSAAGGRMSLSVPTAVAQVFAADTPLPQARFPASGLRLMPAGTRIAQDVLPDAAALTGRPLAGARLHARTHEWFVEERAIADDAGRLAEPLRYPLRPKTGYQLSGKAWMLGEGPGWAWDASEGRLHVRAPAGAALAMVPEGPLLEVTGRGSLVLQGLALTAAGGDAVRSTLNGEVRIEGVDIRRAVGNGVSIAGARSAEVVRSTIEDVGLDAVFFAEVRRVLVRGNVVRNAGLYAGLRPALAAINAHRTDAATVEDNLVERSAYHGIRFAGDALIRRNTVVQSCLLLSDCAALYTWRRNATDVRPHSKVTGNLVIGVAGDTSVKLGVNDWFVGIYLDEFTSDVEVSGNVLAGVNQGIYLHNAWAVDVRGNLVAARLRTLIDAGERLPADPARTPNRMAGNDELLGDYDARPRRAASASADGSDEPPEVDIVAAGRGSTAALRCDTAALAAWVASAGARAAADAATGAAFGTVRLCR